MIRWGNADPESRVGSPGTLPGPRTRRGRCAKSLNSSSIERWENDGGSVKKDPAQVIAGATHSVNALAERSPS